MQTTTSRQRRLNIRLSQQEWDRVKKLAANTTCRSISEYSRQLVLDKPVRVFYRNQSFDDFEQLMIRLLGDLDGVGNKIDHFLAAPVIRLFMDSKSDDIKTTLLQLLTAHQEYAQKTEEIKEAIIKLADLCAQK